MVESDKQKIVRELSQVHDLDFAALMAVVEVESAGRIFAMINGKPEPMIRFEGHYFYRLLGKSKRNIAVTSGLAHRRAGRIKNPSTQNRRWQMLRRAQALDHQAALESTSWGVGQVMGIHWGWLGYPSVDTMVEKARSGLEGQLELMLRYIKKADLLAALQRLDWRAFARGYNGPGYERHGYHTKLQHAYKRYSPDAGMPDLSARHRPLVLRQGDSGEAVEELQKLLRSKNVWVETDGDFGPLTRIAVETFQRKSGLAVDGIAGPKTFRVLMR